MSLKSFRDVISTSFELEDSDVIDNLYRKLKDRLGELLERPSANTSNYELVMEDTLLNGQWEGCKSIRGLKISKKTAR